MDFREYEEKAARTDAKVDRDLVADNAELLNVCLGLTGEAGEFADLVKKVLYQGHEFTPEITDKLKKELGDILWYAAKGARLLGSSLEAAAIRNIAKLEARYPDGFESDRSINRLEA